MSITLIVNDCGLHADQCRQVSGGDTSGAWQIKSGGLDYFLKTNDSLKFPGLFESEATGLNELKLNSGLVIPSVIKTGSAGLQQYLLLEWMHAVNPSTQDSFDFGTKLAYLHKKPQPYFGWKENNYISILPQDNTRSDSWGFFYSNYRILPLIKILCDAKHFTKKDMVAAERFCKNINTIFPCEPPALLHGDLWNGNYMFTAKGSAVFDPSVYYGHREMDIGMSLLFGGFEKEFYNGYNEAYPLEKTWKTRLPVTQLYPLLVHAVLFKGHYIDEARKTMMKYT